MAGSGAKAKLAFRVPPQVVPALLDSCENLGDAQKNVWEPTSSARKSEPDPIVFRRGR